MFDFLSFLVGLLAATVAFLGLEVHNLKAKIVAIPVEETPVEKPPFLSDEQWGDYLEAFRKDPFFMLKLCGHCVLRRFGEILVPVACPGCEDAESDDGSYLIE